MAELTREQMRQQIRKMFGKEPTEKELDESMQGWADADANRKALEDAGVTYKEQVQAFSAQVPDVLRTMLAENGVTEYTDAEFEKLCREAMEAGKLGGMQRTLLVLDSSSNKRKG
jgi:hypothetical protein